MVLNVFSLFDFVYAINLKKKPCSSSVLNGMPMVSAIFHARELLDQNLGL
jgi:hypothetical protein